MPDETTTAPAPTEAPTTAPTEQPETYSRADVEAILAAERKATPSAPSDPVARFRAAVGAKQPEQKAQPASRMESLLESMLALQVANMQPPRPPPPPKMLSLDEKLASTDPATWLGHDPATKITPADRAQLVQRHAAKLTAEGFRGNVEAEANARTAREISTAFTRACGGVKVAVGATNEAAALLESLRGRR